MNPDKEMEMTEKFLCPGCVLGSGTECGHYKPRADNPPAGGCSAHRAGTFVMPGGKMALGLPKGFNKTGNISETNIYLYGAGTKPEWDFLNIPVWAWEGTGEDAGYLFVRCYSPRVNYGSVEIIEGGKMSDCPGGTLDVASFLDKID